MLSNKARFISAILDDTLDLRRKKTAAVVELLKEHKYDMVDGDGDYKYLVRMPLDSVTEENVDRIIKEKERKLMELQTLEKTSEVQLWLNELAVLRKEYLVYRTKKQESGQSTTTTTTPKKVVKKKLVNLKLNA